MDVEFKPHVDFFIAKPSAFLNWNVASIVDAFWKPKIAIGILHWTAIRHHLCQEYHPVFPYE